MKKILQILFIFCSFSFNIRAQSNKLSLGIGLAASDGIGYFNKWGDQGYSMSIGFQKSISTNISFLSNLEIIHTEWLGGAEGIGDITHPQFYYTKQNKTPYYSYIPVDNSIYEQATNSNVTSAQAFSLGLGYNLLKSKKHKLILGGYLLVGISSLSELTAEIPGKIIYHKMNLVDTRFTLVQHRISRVISLGWKFSLEYQYTLNNQFYIGGKFAYREYYQGYLVLNNLEFILGKSF